MRGDWRKGHDRKVRGKDWPTNLMSGDFLGLNRLGDCSHAMSLGCSSDNIINEAGVWILWSDRGTNLEHMKYWEFDQLCNRTAVASNKVRLLNPFGMA